MKLVLFCLASIYIFQSVYALSDEKVEPYMCSPWRNTRDMFSWDGIVNAWYTLVFPYTFSQLPPSTTFNQALMCWAYRWYDLGIVSIVLWLLGVFFRPFIWYIYARSIQKK